MNELSKLKWRCRRGMKELDVLLTRYLEQCYEQAPIAEQQTFQALLELPDMELYAYLLGQLSLYTKTTKITKNTKSFF
ncbi:hypothetical protein PN36_27835 [Candidatus Thiomargarita nelsonii]|uniref:FAD assembly factor SdhE n=1 Tax=Candidatus Thiomargarita nelsonii TaxID=1003181 RepID=A0A4E0QLU6_9GAMM|nr:hypothetical protein PN36_27835 [Candidatus Thiomargarita nelsonii]